MEVVDADEAVVIALADEGEGVGVGCPGQTGDFSASVEKLFRFRCV